ARLVEAALELDPLRQTRLEALQCFLDALAHFEDVVALFLVRGHEYGALAVETTDMAPRLRLPFHVRNVAHAHDAAFARSDHRLAHLIERGVAAGGFQAEAARTEIDDAGGNVRVFALDRLDHLSGREPELGHALQVDFDAQLALR